MIKNNNKKPGKEVDAVDCALFTEISFLLV